MRLSLFRRMMKHTDKNGPVPACNPTLGPCWIWMGAKTPEGYGCVYIGPGLSPGAPHRLIFMAVQGPVPAGRELDHLCRVRSCVNPFHLEPVTRSENCHRGVRKSLQTHCRNGHLLSGLNLRRDSRGGRSCVICYRKHSRDWARNNRRPPQ